MVATECNFNFRSPKKLRQQGTMEGGGVGRGGCALACSFLRGGKAREADEGGGGVEGDAGESGAGEKSKRKLKGKDFFLKRENGPESLFCLLLSFSVFLRPM